MVVDNTNIMLEARSKWVQKALALGVPIRCIVLETPKDVALLLHRFRSLFPPSIEPDRAIKVCLTNAKI